VYIVAFLLLIGVLLKWFWSLPRRTKWLLALAIALMVFGQIGLEAFTGFLNAQGNYDIILRGLEKFVGRAGLIVLFITLLDYIQLLPVKQRPKITLNIS
jgi:hypothetical protein